MKQHLLEKGDNYDVVFLFRPQVADAHLKDIRSLCPKAKIIYGNVDLHFLRMSREALLYQDKAKGKAAEEMEQIELGILQEVDSCIVHSTVEVRSSKAKNSRYKNTIISIYNERQWNANNIF